MNNFKFNRKYNNIFKNSNIQITVRNSIKAEI